MFFPIRSDRRLKRTPWVNYGLIGANVVVFMLTFNLVAANDHAVTRFYLSPGRPSLEQFITYQFLHVDWMHLLFNMLFLWVFGNSVEDRLGHVGYLFFYLAAGVMAGLGHVVSETLTPGVGAALGAPVLGASGAVAGVTGAYLALFPLSNITIAYFFFFIGAFEVTGMVLILFKMGQDLLFYLVWDQGVAYVAHLAGYLFGFVIGMTLLLTHLLTREPYDLLSLIEQKRRRAQFNKLTRGGYQPWEGGSPGKAGSPDAKGEGKPPTEQEQQLMTLRSGISEAMGRHDMPAAARQYVDLIRQAPGQVLSQQGQLDIANQLMSEQRYDHAAAAYELFLKHYSSYPERQHVQLILGLIYGRYLHKPDRARELLADAMPRLSDSDRKLAESVLGEVGS